ncbi:MAG: polysaccharide deacetylase family protein [Verrucomicrobiota bacterium]
MTAATEFLPILAAAQANSGSLVVSLHDVAPVTRAACEEILKELQRVGIRTTSLLVVPDYHHRGRAADDVNFVRWLCDLQEEGHEIVLHGYYHQRPRPQGESWPQRLITSVYTQNEGEFFDLPYDEAFQRITRGAEELREAGLAPVGFVAPAWLLGAESERAARDAGMQYTTRLASVLDFSTNEKVYSRSLVYSTRSSWRRQASLLWNAALARSCTHADLVRIGIHPPDISATEIWRQLTRLARQLAAERAVTTYRDWVGEERRSRAAS